MSCTYVFEPADPDEWAFLGMTTGFEALKLHDRNDRNWAVVRQPSGAIAVDRDGNLLFRLTQGQAEDTAATMTEAIDEPSPLPSLHAQFTHGGESSLQRRELRLAQPGLTSGDPRLQAPA